MICPNFKYAVTRLVQVHSSCRLGQMACYVHTIVCVFVLWCFYSHAFRIGDTIASVSEERFARDGENDDISTTNPINE